MIDPEPGVAGKGHAARHVDRVITAELRAIDVGMGDKGGAVALIVETPDRSGFGRLEVGQPEHRMAVDEIGDGVETFDRKPREAVDHHPFGGGWHGRQNRPKPRKCRPKGLKKPPEGAGGNFRAIVPSAVVPS